MSEKPILFNTEMVKAILEGRKTCTRRIIKPKYSNTHLEMFTNKYGTRLVEKQNEVEGETFGKNEDGTSWHKLLSIRETEDNPPYKIGDILYVRETWKQYEKRVGKGGQCHLVKINAYKADENNASKPSEFYEGKWRPSIHMPKLAARIFLKVTDVRVEKLQDITEEQAKSEGCIDFNDKIGDGKFEDVLEFDLTAKDAFSELWNSTVKRNQLHNYGWNANPWVWVISFERIERSDDL